MKLHVPVFEFRNLKIRKSSKIYFPPFRPSGTDIATVRCHRCIVINRVTKFQVNSIEINLVTFTSECRIKRRESLRVQHLHVAEDTSRLSLPVRWAGAAFYPERIPPGWIYVYPGHGKLNVDGNANLVRGTVLLPWSRSWVGGDKLKFNV